MRQLLFFLALIPALLAAQTDQRYLAGAVPTVNGKVVFSQEIQAPNLNQQQIYDTLLNWAKQTDEHHYPISCTLLQTGR